MSAGRRAPRGMRTGRTWSGGSEPGESWTPGGQSPSPGLLALGGRSSASPGSSPGTYIYPIVEGGIQLSQDRESKTFPDFHHLI